MSAKEEIANKKPIIYLPLVLLLILWSVHSFLADVQPFFARDYFGELTLAVAFIYGVLLAAGNYYRELGKKIAYQSPFYIVVASLLILWELLTLKSGLLPLPYFPSMAAVIAAVIKDWETLLISVLYSMRLLFMGYFFGLIFGIPAGVFMGWSPRFNYWLSPVLKMIGPIPATAWIPIVMVVFPTSFSASVFLVALAAWFPITVMTWSGVANVSKSYYEVARTLGADSKFLVFRVALPAALPSIFVGLFSGLGVSFVTLVVAELLGVKAGLGWYIQWAQGWAEYVKVYAALMVMAILFSSLITLLFRVRDRLLVWQKGLIRW